MVDFSRANIVSQAQKLKNYGQALRNATRKESSVPQPQTQSGNQQTQTQQETYIYEYSGYDELGRPQKLNEQQYNSLMNKINSNSDKNVIFDVIPEEAANSQSNWWINSNNQYEWTPVTDSDKAHLEEINRYRRSSGLAERTTLVSGAVKSDEYNKKWYSTGGGNRGKGSTNVKIVKKLDHTGQVQLKDGTWINQVERKGNDAPDSVTIYESKEARQEAIKAQQKAREEAQKRADAYKPIISVTGSEISPIEVKSSSRESSKGAKGIISGDGYFSREKAVAEHKFNQKLFKETGYTKADLDLIKSLGETSPFKTVNQLENEALDKELNAFAGDSKIKGTIADIFKVTYSKENLISTINAADKKVSGYLPTVSEIGQHRQKTISNIFSPKAAESYESQIEKAKSENTALAFASDFSIGQYESLRDKPISKTSEALLLGYGFGAGTRLTTIAGKKGLEKVGLATASRLVEPVAAVGTIGLMGSETVNTYKESGAKGLGAYSVDLAVGGIGYGKGNKHILSLWDRYHLRGATEVPTNKIISGEVLSGETTLPMTKSGQPAASIIKDFTTPEGTYKGWHATGNLMKDLTVRGVDEAGNVVKARPADNPGLYVSGDQKGLSPHFLRVNPAKSSVLSSIEQASSIISTSKATGQIIGGFSGKVIGYGGKIIGKTIENDPLIQKSSKIILNSGKLINEGIENFNTPLNPNAMHIEITGGVHRLPGNVRKDTKLSDQFLANEAPKGSAFLTSKLERNIKSGKAEHEATIVPGTKLEVQSENQFFRYGDRRILIRELKTVSDDPVNILQRKQINIGDILKSSDYGKSRNVKGGYTPVGYKPSGYAPTGYKPSGYAPTGYKPSGYAPTGYKPSGYAPTGYKPSGYTPVGYKPSGYTPVGYKPSGYAPTGYKPSGYTPVGYKPSGYAPTGYKPSRDKAIIKLPDMSFPGLPADSNRLINYGHKMKNHYVLDPQTFIFGKKGR